MRCTARNRSGSSCGANALRGQSVCHMHSTPGRAAVLGAAGGRRRAITTSHDLRKFRPPSSAQELQALLAQTIVDVRSGSLDPRCANATAILGSTFIRALETGSLEQRVAQLETKQQERDWRKR